MIKFLRILSLNADKFTEERMMKFKWSSIWFQRSVLLGITIAIATGILHGYADYQKQVAAYMDHRLDYGSTHDEIQQMRQVFKKRLAEANEFFADEDDEGSCDF
ncbi:hypothetical protein KPH14_007760 [Odynerus spinipes]|uniref:Uncharacterized protein n=1 Tax=Odynerus spinipes TaxID=1348599 RepID=A0AAD9VNA4_9HYME|nr:hypothetical protein KPH14_007760 [Odynerus spinipes]